MPLSLRGIYKLAQISDKSSFNLPCLEELVKKATHDLLSGTIFVFDRYSGLKPK